MIAVYSHKDHFETLQKWNAARFQYGIEPWMLPDIGFVCDDNAMAFLVTTNSPVAWFAHWTVDPKLNHSDRAVSIGKLIEVMEQVAKDKGFKLTQTLGKVGYNISEILKSHGYNAAHGDYTFFVKDIRS